MRFNHLGLLSFVLISSFWGCTKDVSVSSKQENQKHVSQEQINQENIKKTNLEQPSILSLQSVSVLESDRPSLAPGVANSQSVQVVARVNQEELLNQEFLYGADLQYSSNYDANLDLYNQTMAIGHIPARFRIVGEELQLVSDNKRLFASDVNHPEKLISRFKILSRGAGADGTTTLTISGANSGYTLARIFAKSIESKTDENSGLEDLWIRSFEFVPAGNYILQQTSITLVDGTQAEFMESIFPSKTLEPGKDFQKIQMDPADPVGGKSGIVARFRFLAGDSIFESETPVAYAQHFDLSPKADGTPATLDFYVTPNIPDEHLEAIKNGTEGWNRYFLNFSGPNFSEPKRAVVQFKGKLPEGIHLGDPRYNVIAWDNRKVAGAAYETQAADPRTGKQSHTIIYMPAAWVKIGADYWRGGQFSDPKLELGSDSTPIQSRNLLLTKKPRCDRNLNEVASIIRSGRLPAEEIKTFGTLVLQQTLLHEVGHSLGLAHNFKGSLTYDPTNPKSLFSSSIMDYNDYEIERQAFESVHSWKGPSLEYDRQALSAIYNASADISDSDTVLPACADAEADKTEGGVDPLCNRYDIENDPTHSITTAHNRIFQSNLPNDVTLSQAILRLGTAYTDSETIKKLNSLEELVNYLKEFTNALNSSFQFYLVSGKASLTTTLMTNIKSLLEFQPDVLPDSVDEGKLRLQALDGLLKFLQIREFPAEIDKSLQTVATQLTTALTKAPAMSKINPTKQSQLFDSLKSLVTGVSKQFLNDQDHGLQKARAAIFLKLKNQGAPFFLGTIGNSQVDFEGIVTNLLFKQVTDFTRGGKERLAAAISLSTYKGRSPVTDQLISLGVTTLEQERNLGKTNEDREEAIALLKLLNNKSTLTVLALR